MSEQGKKSYYLQDDLGSTMNLLDEEGRSREAYVYDEFGIPLENSEPERNAFEPVQPFGFTGYQMDETTGLYFAQARRYDAGSGRFVSEDKIKGNITAPFTLNPYGYCWNRPMDLVDLDGNTPTPTAGVCNVISCAPEANNTGYGGSTIEPSYSSRLNAGVIRQFDYYMTAGSSCETVSEDTEQSTWEIISQYLIRSTNQIIKGNFTDDVTLLGTVGEVVIGLAGLDVICDIRDIASDADALFWHTDREVSAWQVVLDLVAVIPLVGVVKYSDEIGTLVKRIDFSQVKNALGGAATSIKRTVGSWGDSLGEFGTSVGKKLSGAADDIKVWANGAADSVKTWAGGAGNSVKTWWSETTENVKAWWKGGTGVEDEVIEGGTTTLNDWVNKTSDLSKQAPIEIPSGATVKIQAKNGYDQITFKWTENGQNYEVRWHTKTPGAPEGQGNTWVVSRVTPGTPTGQARTEHILVGDTWIPRYQWQDAINAYGNRTATTEQLQLLKDGHWKAP